VNIPVLDPAARSLVELSIEEGVKVVITAAGNPATFTPTLKDNRVKVLHVVASRRHALGAERAGVDAVIAEGYEAGGHNGLDELPTFVLVPEVVDAVTIPVVAAGGIADARGLVAALALGAEGVQMGTRFVATTECCAHPSFKQAVVDALDTGTVITGRKIGPTRGIRNRFTDTMLEMEAAGSSVQELLTYIGADRSRKGHLDGDTDEGEMYCGAVASMITGIVGAGEVVRSIVDGADSVISRLQ
jgi:enoyl-[acyl-carrier protein] reductase II